MALWFKKALTSRNSANVPMAVSDIVRKYIKAKQEFFSIAERCAAKGWPDRSQVLRSAFRLQELYCERDQLRAAVIGADLESLVTSQAYELTFSTIENRLGKDWTDSEETGLQQSNSLYAYIASEIAALICIDLEGTTEPFLAAQRDPEYLVAREALGQQMRECNALLNTLRRS